MSSFLPLEDKSTVIKSVMIYLSSGIKNISGTLSKVTVNGLNLRIILKVCLILISDFLKNCIIAQRI